MSRTGENIYKRKDGRWEGRYIKERSLTGKAIYGYVYAPTYHELKEKMSEIIYHKKNNHVISKDITFKNISQEWLLSIYPHIKESTANKYNNMLNNYILPFFGNYLIRSLTNEIVQAFCNNLLLEGGNKKEGLSPKTVADCLTLLRSIMQYSVNNGYATTCNFKSVIIKQNMKKIRVLSRLEQEQLCTYLYSNLNEKNIGILLCLFTGLRVGEICALKWKDISIADQTLHIHQTMQRIQTRNESKKTKILISSPKSSTSIRTIPLPEKIIHLLLRYEKSRESYLLSGLEDSYVEPRIMQKHFHKVTSECSIDSANFHTLRHTFATRCVELGFDVKSLSEILGHSSVNITMNRYVHPSMELKKQNMKRLSELISVK